MNSLLLISAITLIVVIQSSSAEAQSKASGYGDGIIVIEDQTTVPSGLYVSTSDIYYSIVSPLLLKVGWVSVSVNDNHVSVLLEKGIFFFTSFTALGKKQRELLFDIRSRFLISTTGLTFSQGASSRSYGGITGASANNYATTILGDTYGITEGGVPRGGVYQSYGQNKSPGYSACPSFNYYNVFHTSLNLTLDGDIYFLDFNGNVLDIYSRTVSYFKKPGQSILYRDHRYFVYHRLNMPLTINRIILIGQYIFLVYNDYNVLAKASWQLNPAELEVTSSARSEIKRLIDIQDSAAKVNAAATSAQETPLDFEDDDLLEKKLKIDEIFDPELKSNSSNKLEELSIEKKVLAEPIKELKPKEVVVATETIAKDPVLSALVNNAAVSKAGEVEALATIGGK